MFTFGGPGGFQARYGGGAPRRRGPQTPDEGASPLMALLPVLLLFAFALLSIIPSLFGATPDPDPRYGFEPTTELSAGRETFSRGIPYFVSPKEWEGSAIWQQVPETKRSDVRAGLYSPKLRQFERGVEQVYVRKLQNEVGFAFA